MLTPLNRNSAEAPVRPVKVLQFGEGNFLRAFTDWIFDIANDRGVIDAGIAVVSPRFRRSESLQTLAGQDGLYHVVLEGIEGGQPKREVRLVKCVQDVFTPLDDYKKYESYICSPDLRFVVSNTTEAGIRYDEDDVLAEVPATFPGKITALLYKRYQHFGGDPGKGLIFLCCELIENNGSLLREYVLRHARRASLPEDFISWVEQSCIFSDALVDRIVSGFPKDSIDAVKEEIGYDDNAVVVGELYHLWVIGGKDAEKVRAELPLDRCGLHVEFHPSVQEYREKKVRVLNGSHTGMVAMGLLAGCQTVLVAFKNQHISRFVHEMVEKEVLPVIAGDRAELAAFADGILERFLNPYIKHNLSSIALNSLSKWETRNFPTLKDFYEKTGKIAEYEVFTFAALMALYAPGSGFTPDDSKEALEAISRAWAGNDSAEAIPAILRSGIFLADFEACVPGFTAKAVEYTKEIQAEGIEAALAKFLANHN